MPSTSFDQKLIKKTRSNLMPSWSQFKYLGSFLTKMEKLAINIAFAVLLFTIVGWGTLWFFKNMELVAASGGEYSEALIGQPKYVNPLFTPASAVDADLASLVYSGLFQFNNQQKLLPDLASNYTVSSDGKIYDINLRKDVKWSDGEPFNADDVIYTFQTIADPEVGSPLLAAFQNVQVERTGDYSVRFILKDPFAPFLSSLTVGILPQHTWANIPPAAVRLAKTNLQPVGSGPWKFSKLTKDSSGNIQNYTLERNDQYYRNTPYLKTLTFKFYSDYTQAASALKSQEVMAISFLPNDLADKIAGKNFELYRFQLPQYSALFFNQDATPILRDSDMRLALSSAINKNEILTQALAGEGEVVNSPILKDNVGYNPSIAFPAFDREKANQILDKNWKKIEPEEFFKFQYDAVLKTRKNEIDELKKNATTTMTTTTTTTTEGQVEQTTLTPEQAAEKIQQIEKEISDSVREDMSAEQSFYRKNKANEFLTVTITTADTPEYQKVAASVAKMWRAVGVKTKIQLVNSNQIARDVLRDRSYQALLYGEIVGSDPDPYPFWHSSQINYPGLNLSMFVNRTADKLLEDARATTTEKTRADLYEKFQQILVKELPAVFLYAPVYDFVASQEIKGITFKKVFSPADRFNDLGNWYIKTKRQWRRS
ncbi:MAG: Uncharacterized protein G01um101413_758 [Parcubacteria group bacterium Gr01-1014_13]|nr:MAG: Uncharacterized protein G01um101413_758 [Parcubacteria group bacterium Gr01-1014_13]